VTAVARRYYEKVPKRLEDAVVCLPDPMLATGGSAAMAIEGPKSLGARRVRLRCVVAAPEGVAYLEKREPEAEVYTAALDRPLNDCKYILRGPEDFGNRLVGT
jgi:uracil phosphoribosyltransferase